jgi:hypothetical protein
VGKRRRGVPFLVRRLPCQRFHLAVDVKLIVDGCNFHFAVSVNNISDGANENNPELAQRIRPKAVSRFLFGLCE